MSSVLALCGARQVVLDGCRRTARHRFTRRAGWIGVGLVGTALLLGPLRTLLELSIGVALGVAVAFAALGAIAALLVHRRGQELRGTEPVLSGRRFETTHEDVRVHRVERARGGEVTLSMSWRRRHQIELDPGGVPLSVGDLGAGSSTWPIPAELVLCPADLQALQALVGRDLSLVEHAVLAAQGTTVTRRVLASSQGVVLDLHG